MRTLQLPVLLSLLTACLAPEEPFDPGPSVERCTDGIDNDENGLVDCDDEACEANPVCYASAEDCGDGWDNDFDGLLDCEDADCAAVCSPEICDNGLDDDDDGAVDCDDADCVGGDCAATLSARVTGGGSVRTKRQWTGVFDQCAGSSSAIVGQGTIVATGIFGVLERIPENGEPTECAWGFEAATHRFELYGDRFSAANVLWQSVQRQGFEIDEGCGTSGSAFLPQTLFPSRTSSGAPAAIWATRGDNPRSYYGVFDSGYALWYYGDAARTSSANDYSYVDACRLEWTYGYGAVHDGLRSGSPYITER